MRRMIAHPKVLANYLGPCGQVHTSVGYPAWRGPLRSFAISRAFCVRESRGLGPGCSLARNAWRPPCCIVCFQRETEEGATSSKRAISRTLLPWAKSLPPRWRRYSSWAALPLGLMLHIWALPVIPLTTQGEIKSVLTRGRG